MRPSLFIALDYPDFTRTHNMVRQLDNIEENFGYKLNLDFLISNNSFKVLDLETNRQVFADMKMWNGVRTMTETCISLQNQGFDFTNIHSLCGLEMMRELAKNLKGYDIKVFAVTILTHYDDKYCVQHFGKSMEIEICHLLQDINLSGLFGAILPGSMLKNAKRFLETDKTLVPAIRPKGYEEKRKDQLQTTSIQDAVEGNADFVVCGSPITKSENPRESLISILEELKEEKNG